MSGLFESQALGIALILAGISTGIAFFVDFITIEAGAIERWLGAAARGVSVGRFNHLHRAHKFAWEKAKDPDNFTRTKDWAAGRASGYQSKRGDKHRLRSTIEAGILTFVLLVIMNYWWIYLAPPTFSGGGWLGIVTVNLILTVIVFACFAGLSERFSAGSVVAGIAILAILGSLVWNALPLQGYSNVFGSRADVSYATKLTDYPPTLNSNIIMTSDQTALARADQLLSAKIPGTTDTIGSRYGVQACDQKPVNGQNWYLCSLRLTGTSNNQADQYQVACYIRVSAEDPTIPAQPMCDYHMSYTIGAPFTHSIQRLIWRAYPRAYVDDLTLEVTNTWQPMYTATLDYPATKFQQSLPYALITVDPQTGVIRQYPLTDSAMPQWVTRVYSAQMAVNYVNWWGQWGVVPWSTMGSGGRYQVDGSAEQVFTTSGPAWQMEVTPLTSSGSSTTSVAYIALMNTRTGHITMYPAPPGTTTATSVEDVVSRSGINIVHLDAADPQIHRLFGEMVWIGPLLPAGTAGNGQPETSSGCFALDATSTAGSDVIIGTSLSDCIQQLAAQVASGQINNIPGGSVAKKSVVGTVTHKSAPIPLPHGGAFITFFVKGSSHVFQYTVSDQTQTEDEAAMMNPGDEVIVTFLDSGQVTVNASSVTVLSLNQIPTPVGTGTGK